MAGCQVSPKALHSEVKRAIHFQKKKDTDGRIPARFVKGVKSRAQLRRDILKYEAFKDAAEVILTNCTRHVCAHTQQARTYAGVHSHQVDKILASREAKKDKRIAVARSFGDYIDFNNGT